MFTLIYTVQKINKKNKSGTIIFSHITGTLWNWYCCSGIEKKWHVCLRVKQWLLILLKTQAIWCKLNKKPFFKLFATFSDPVQHSLHFCSLWHFALFAPEKSNLILLYWILHGILAAPDFSTVEQITKKNLKKILLLTSTSVVNCQLYYLEVKEDI